MQIHCLEWLSHEENWPYVSIPSCCRGCASYERLSRPQGKYGMSGASGARVCGCFLKEDLRTSPSSVQAAANSLLPHFKLPACHSGAAFEGSERMRGNSPLRSSLRWIDTNNAVIDCWCHVVDYPSIRLSSCLSRHLRPSLGKPHTEPKCRRVTEWRKDWQES
jgi:hypothetical protein